MAWHRDKQAVSALQALDCRRNSIDTIPARSHLYLRMLFSHHLYSIKQRLRLIPPFKSTSNPGTRPGPQKGKPYYGSISQNTNPPSGL